ncbi:MAG: hypothetical protein E7570_01600, partial [Ruminococcaceae bacterium]|nr:hypothetical protein [Oscillospiraceae bacterium]
MDKLSLKQKQLFGILISVVFHLFLVQFCLIKPVTYEFVAVESRAFHCIMLGVVLLSLVLSIILTKRINTFSMLIPIIAFQAFEIYYTIAFSRKLYEDNTSNILSFIFRQNITWVIAIVFSVILGVIILLSAIPKTAILKIIASVLIVAFSILKIFVQLIYRIIHFYGIKYVFRELFLFV